VVLDAGEEEEEEEEEGEPQNKQQNEAKYHEPIQIKKKQK